MAVGFWNKLKQFGKNVWSGIKKVAAPVMKVVKPLVNQFKTVIPGGELISKGLDFVDDNIVKPHMGPGDKRVQESLQRATPFISLATQKLNDRIKFKS